MQFRDSRKIKKHIEVLIADYEWFIKTHELAEDSSRTGFSGLMAMLLHSYRTVCENPKEYAEKMVGIAKVDITNKGAEIVKEEILDGTRYRENREGVKEDEGDEG